MPLLKVADFGFARFLPNATLADTLCGSPLYMGPEILSYQKYDAKADLWSVGAVLYEMVTGRPPFRAQNHLELLKKIQENEDRIRFPDEKQQQNDASSSTTTHNELIIGVGEDMKDLIRKLLKKDPVERISFEEFFNHTAITSPSPPPPSSSSSIPMSPSPFVSTSSSRIKRSSGISSSPRQQQVMDHETSYEPPPFAQSPGTPRQHFDWKRAQQMENNNITGRMSPSPRDSGRARADESPLYSRGKSWKGQYNNNNNNNNDQSRPPWIDSQESNNHTLRRNLRGENEEVLQEYVVVDKNIIENNQFADELNASPRTEAHNQLTHRHSQTTEVAIPRRSSQEYYQQQQLPSPSSTGSTPPYTITRERKISAGSAGSALAKALSVATVRLFGTGNSPPKISTRSQQVTTQTTTIPGSPRGFLITEGGLDSQEGQAMKTIERAACMAHAVARFADSKFDQLISGKSVNEALLAEEAMVLHIKALSLLELGLSTARQFWSHVSDDTMRTVSVRLNDAVQWMRERFNECLDRASFAGTKCDNDTQNGMGACVEKLLYDRALEM
ncbi:hypothetical protein INT45_010703, partial [Circinella minor]